MTCVFVLPAADNVNFFDRAEDIFSHRPGKTHRTGHHKSMELRTSSGNVNAAIGRFPFGGITFAEWKAKGPLPCYAGGFSFDGI